jgi:hypothetical protein
MLLGLHYLPKTGFFVIVQFGLKLRRGGLVPALTCLNTLFWAEKERLLSVMT